MINPMMHPKEVELVKSYLKKDQVVLEWGCGGSTTNFPQLVKKYYSIEHNLDWFWKVQQELYDENIENVEMHLCDYPKGVPSAKEDFFDMYDDNLIYASEHLNTNITSLDDCVYPKERYAWHEYIDYIDKLGVDCFDVIFIDGRARTDCAYKALNYISEDSIVFIHDFWPRTAYHKVFEWYDEIDSIKETGHGRGSSIVALKKKSQEI